MCRPGPRGFLCPNHRAHAPEQEQSGAEDTSEEVGFCGRRARGKEGTAESERAVCRVEQCGAVCSAVQKNSEPP